MRALFASHRWFADAGKVPEDRFRHAAAMQKWLLAEEAPAVEEATGSPAAVDRSWRRLGSLDSPTAKDVLGRLDSEIDSVFSSIRSQSSDDLQEEHEKNRRYAAAGAWGRAFPERYIALLVTLLVEIPVAFIITSGSKDLSHLIGPDRYALLMAFLPLTSAISGNVGLQASTLTTRAISHGDCCRGSYCRWLLKELSAAGLLSVFVGLVVGLVAWLWTWSAFEVGPDAGFALTVGFAQAFSIAIAGLTGTCAPLLFTFIFHGDAGKWAGPMETAVQDVAGSFAMVYVAQATLVWCIRLGLSPAITN